MDTIINYICENFTKNIEKNIKNFISDSKSLAEFSFDLQESLNDVACHTISETLKLYDNAIKSNPDRVENFEVVHSSKPKTILTSFGSVSFNRTYYLDKHSGERLYLLDSMVGISDHDSMSDDVVINCIDEATDSNYSKAGDSCCLSNDSVSKQSVKRVIHDLDPKIILFPVVPPKNKKSVPFLYIEADEDHVHLQKGSNAIAKLVYVHEGISSVTGYSSRNLLENTRYFDGFHKSNENLWFEVLDYIDSTYDIDSIKRIYISGDGASWIRKGCEFIPNSKFVLDAFHMMKYIRQASAHVNSELAYNFKSSLSSADYDSFMQSSSDIVKFTKDSAIFPDSKLKCVVDSINYLISNWDGIAIKTDTNEKTIGCSAEGHISHIFSSRLSSRPKGWSEHGLDIMCKLIVYKKNGGSIKDLILSQHLETMTKSKSPRVSAIQKTTVKSMSSKYYNYFNHSVPVINNGRITGTYCSLSSLVNLKKVI